MCRFSTVAKNRDYTVLKALYLLHSTINFFIQTIWLNKIVFYTAVIAGCVIAFSPAEAGLQPALNDKFLHTTGFMIMAFLSHLAHPYLKKRYPIVGLVILGFVIEAVQAYLPYRDFSLWDWGADILGVVLYFQVCARPLNHFFFNATKHKYVPD
jgi:VanZ family protein